MYQFAWIASLSFFCATKLPHELDEKTYQQNTPDAASEPEWKMRKHDYSTTKQIFDEN